MTATVPPVSTAVGSLKPPAEDKGTVPLSASAGTAERAEAINNRGTGRVPFRPPSNRKGIFMTNQNKQKAAFHSPEPTEYKIGGTTYIVRTHLKKNASEGLLDKIWRLIQNDELTY